MYSILSAIAHHILFSSLLQYVLLNLKWAPLTFQWCVEKDCIYSKLAESRIKRRKYSTLGRDIKIQVVRIISPCAAKNISHPIRQKISRKLLHKARNINSTLHWRNCREIHTIDNVKDTAKSFSQDWKISIIFIMQPPSSLLAFSVWVHRCFEIMVWQDTKRFFLVYKLFRNRVVNK